jgi:hypothetical protein
LGVDCAEFAGVSVEISGVGEIGSLPPKKSEDAFELYLLIS